MVFSDRIEAGGLLAKFLERYRGKDVLICGLPRGGIVVAAEVAKALDAPLEPLIIRKIGHPNNPEYAVCAVSINGSLICNEDELLQIDPVWFEAEAAKQKKRARNQFALYLGKRKPLSPENMTAIIVDDGIATGLTMKAAIKEIRNQNPKQIIVAVPVIPKEIYQELRPLSDDIVTLETPEQFTGSVGAYYDLFPQVSDEEVVAILQGVPR